MPIAYTMTVPKRYQNLQLKGGGAQGIVWCVEYLDGTATDLIISSSAARMIHKKIWT